jgi:tryptophan halogenase
MNAFTRKGDMTMIRSVLVVGGGSAGWLAAITLKTRLPQLTVQVLHSRELGIIGVGEGTTPVLPRYLHGYLNIDLAEFYREAQPTWKLGIRFLWGTRPHFNYTFHSQVDSQFQALSKATGYYCDEDMNDLDLSCALMNADRAFARQPNGVPLIGLDAAYHLENETFVAFLERHAAKLGISQIDGRIVNIAQNAQGIESLQIDTGEVFTADLFVDCSGFRSLLLGETLGEPFCSFSDTLFCDRAIVGGWNRSSLEPILPYTTSESMDAGWCWRIDHETRIHRGYVFSSEYLTDEQAERAYREKCPQAGDTRFVSFRSGYYARDWVKNVVAIGNASGFVEPLEATALAVICNQSLSLAETLAEIDQQEISLSMRKQYNQRFANEWHGIRDFLAIHYKFNQKHSTAFWHDCREKIELGSIAELVDFYQENGPSLLFRDLNLSPHDPFKIDGYWTMLLGQHVPYRRSFQPTPAEQETVRKIRASYRSQAKRGVSVAEALQAIRSPQWQWDQNFYRKEFPELLLRKG